MKSSFISAALITAMLFGTTSCGIAPAGSGQATAQTSNQSVLGGLLGQGGILNTLGGIFSSKLIPSEQQVLGTWVYQSPAVIFDSENVLTNLGGTAASSAIETKLQSYLQKYGITPGSTTITFNKDKSFVFATKNKNIKGTYKVVNNNIQLTFEGMEQQSRLTPQLNNGTLVIAGDATKIKDFLQGIAASSSRTELNSISSLLSQFNGMQLGIRLQKK